MNEGPTAHGARSGTRQWSPCAPDVEELQRTIRWTAPDESLEPGWESASLRRGQLLPGTRLRIESYLGEGTTAIVYRGHHVDLGRALAIKVLKELDPDEHARERFLAEARLTSELDSDYVVDVLDFGRLEDGRLYYAMAYLEGEPLDEILADGPLPLHRALPLLRMACKGLQHAHDRGIVHRDVKPENMMVVQRRGREHLVLVDFGIATSSGSSGERVCGTPYTMAPEQIECRPVDARTDIYALGCCAFQMLTGRPFAAATTLNATLARHLSEERGQIDPSCGVPRSIAQVIHRCLALDPADRFDSARELEAALCEAQIDAGVSEVGHDLPPPEVDEVRRQRICTALARPRRRLRVLRAGTLGIAAGALLAFGGWRIALARERPSAGFERATPIVASIGTRIDAPLFAESEPVDLRDAAFSSAELARAARPAVPSPRPRRSAPRRRVDPPPPAVDDVVESLASISPPDVGDARSSRLGFQEVQGVPWTARGRARQLMRDADRALRVGERRRAHDLYRRAASLGSRRAHERLEELERG